MSVTPITAHPKFRPAYEQPIRRDELQRRLGCSARHIFNLQAEGMPVHRRYRGYNVYLWSEVEGWITRRIRPAHTRTGGSN